MYLGLNGYRPDYAHKSGLGLSIGGAVPISFINHVYDSSESIMVGVETVF